MSALAGPDTRDPWSLPESGSTFAEPLPTTTTAKVAWGGDLNLFECDGEVLAICEAAARTVESVGGSFTVAGPSSEHAEYVFRVLRGLGYARNAAPLLVEQKPDPATCVGRVDRIVDLKV